MLGIIKTVNGQKKVIPLTADAGAGLPVGFIAPAYKKGNYSGWLYLDGRDTTGTSEELSTHYPLLYAYLGSNILPDYREVTITGAEQNTTDTIAVHDVYTEGEFKDDQILDHKHFDRIVTSSASNGNFVMAGNQTGAWANPSEMYVRSSTRKGTVNRGKRKAVFFYIKATSGLSENAQDNVVNTLNEERSYSTSEVNTGKKWIDGKPIYRKVFTGLNYGGTVSDWIDTGATLTNGETLIKAESIRYSSNIYYVLNIISFRLSGNSIQYLTPTAHNNTNILIAEYTKATD